MDDAGDSLAKYRQKRNFAKTLEPEGFVVDTTEFRFVVQKHAANRLHYDLRLELEGVLKSWAVTRGPSLNPADKRLAVQTEDHPVAYRTFEGTIPKSEYGGGTMMVWDEGTWEPIGDPREGLKRGDLKFILHGHRLAGSWALVRMKRRPQDGDRDNWLLIKHKDAAAADDDAEAWLDTLGSSVISGRTMDQIKAGVEGAKPKAKTPARPGPKASGVKAKRTTTKAKALTFMPVELATLADAVPPGDDWVHEVKFDGYRTQALIDQGEVRLLTRSGLDWTEKYAAIARALKSLDVEQAVIDGEIVAIDERGQSNFSKLKDELSAGRSEDLQFYAFDLLNIEGEDIRRHPLSERKARLEALLNDQDLAGKVHYSEHFKSSQDFLPRVCGMQMEGIISKRLDSIYAGKRSKAWLKVKCHKRQEFVIVGFSESDHAGRGFRSLLLGYYEDGTLRFAGKVGTGFNSQRIQEIRSMLDDLEVVKKPFSKLPPDVGPAIWVEPKLVCEVEFTEWTPEGRLRHPSFQGMREDKAATSVGRDREVPIEAAAAEAETEVKATSNKVLSRSTSKGKTEVAGVAISHPERVVWPETGETKLDLARFYHDIAPYILPHVAGRPLSALRAPDTIAGQQFFQRHLPEKGHMDRVFPTEVPVKTRVESYMKIEDEAGLIELVQWGGIEFHPWGAKADNPLKPDRMIFDLDPDPVAPWENVIEGAAEVRDRMRELGMESFLKTTGGKGLHIVVPIVPEFGWPAIKAFTRAVAESMAHDDPKRFIATMSKAARKGRIFVDYLRNDLTATAVSAFSVRARPGAGVSTPLFWHELKPSLKPGDYTIQTVPSRLKTLKSDPWADFGGLRQRLNPAFLKALNIDPV